MNKITLSLEFETPADLAALQSVLTRSHAQSHGVEKAIVGKALASLQKAAELAADQAAVDGAEAEWNGARSRLSVQASALARQLKKGMTKGAVSAVAALHHLAQTQMKATPVLVDNYDLNLDDYRARPAFWLAAVKASGERQIQLSEVAKAALTKLKAESGEPYPVPADAMVAKATVEAWGKAVALIGELGSSSEELNHATLYEAALYATYARAFATDDIKTVAQQYRQANRNQDSFLRTFSDNMKAAASQLTEREGLVWRDEHVASQRKPGPR